MSAVSVTYRALKGDSKVCEWGPFTFFDGVPIDVEENEQTAHMLKKMEGNKCFELGKATGKAPKPQPQAQAPVPEPTPEPALQPAPAPAPEPEPEPETKPKRAVPARHKPVKRTRAHK